MVTGQHEDSYRQRLSTQRAIASARDALAADVDPDIYTVAAAGIDARLFVRRTADHEPDWVALFNGATDRPLDLRRPSFGAVLLLKTDRRWFAITFGSGRFMLRDDCWERNFGLRAALNLVNEEQIRSVQSRTFGDSALHVRRQVARASGVAGLELDLQRDLLTTIEGDVVEGQVGKRVSGADAVRLTDEFDIRDIADKCAGLLEASNATGYKERFPWVDNIQQIASEGRSTELALGVAERIMAGDLEGIDVFPPEMANAAVTHYRFGTGRRMRNVMEPGPHTLQAHLRAFPPASAGDLLTTLKKEHLRAIDGDGTVVGRWPIWDCIYAEIDGSQTVAVLDRGRFYAVKETFAETIETTIGSIHPSGLTFPVAHRDEHEGPYNTRAAGSGAYWLFDRKLLTPVPGETRVEVCDLYSPAGHLVHVKRRKGGSAPFSHLLGQASVSSALLAHYGPFCDQVRGQLQGRFSGTMRDPLRPQDHPVVLALIVDHRSPVAGAHGLPFFSRVFLHQVALQVRGMGFDLHFDEIRSTLTRP